MHISLDWGEPDRLLDLHSRVLQGDATAREAMAGALLNRLLTILVGSLRNVDLAIVNDAVEDAILKYLAAPGRFRPELARLDTFLALVARRRALNNIRSARRRCEASLQVEPVVLAATQCSADDTLAYSLHEILADVRSPLETALVEAWLDGRHRAAELASSMGLGDLPVEEQKRLVRKVKDTLRRRICRHTTRRLRSLSQTPGRG